MPSDKLLILTNVNVCIAPKALTNDNTIQGLCTRLASLGFDINY